MAASFGVWEAEHQSPSKRAVAERKPYPSPRRVRLHVVDLPLHVTKLLRDPLVLLDRVHRADMKVGAAEEEGLGDEIGRGSCGKKRQLEGGARSVRYERGLAGSAA